MAAWSKQNKSLCAINEQLAMCEQQMRMLGADYFERPSLSESRVSPAEQVDRPNGALTAEELAFVALKARYAAYAGGGPWTDAKDLGALEELQSQIFSTAAAFLDKGYSIVQMDSLDRLSRDSVVHGSTELLSADERKLVSMQKQLASIIGDQREDAELEPEYNMLIKEILDLKRTLTGRGTPLCRFQQLYEVSQRP
jgi:hypothetical protein